MGKLGRYNARNRTYGLWVPLYIITLNFTQFYSILANITQNYLLAIGLERVYYVIVGEKSDGRTSKAIRDCPRKSRGVGEA